jgi:beta-phosphoglucomutase-like phosphatase (HAD superfamily)
MKLIIVDLDGTLFDTRKVNYLAYKEALNTFGYNVDFDYFCTCCNGRHYLDFLPKIGVSDENILKRIHEYKKAAYTKYLKYAKENSGLIDILRVLKNDYRIALVKYTAGEGLLLDIIDAQVALSTAKLNFCNAQYDYARHKVELDNDIGLSDDGVNKTFFTPDGASPTNSVTV